MSTYTQDYTELSLITCDRCGTQAARRSEPMTPYDATHEHRVILAAEGWRFYFGRSHRDYCPSCGPNKGHRMRDMTGSYQ